MYKITSKYGQQEIFRNSPHSGIDFKMETGTPLKSIREGDVVGVFDYGDLNAGKCVKIKWVNGETAIYGHMNDFNVDKGQHVYPGDLIGHSGNTGYSTGSHLHFGLKDESGQIIDPSKYIADIQNMNTEGLTLLTNNKLSLFDYFQQHMDFINSALINLKVNLVTIFTSSDYFPIIQLTKNLLKFFFFDV
ncbi:M23 family metallopeptidase [Cytobacillus kochii]|uniref:M23 family metallopeptidase n=1 Tax=Cytobacillus kochii TaxID=859143 RepID=UPI001CD3CF69|nr:M23 family metallopeptidase [Cytobacillus kochii]MCA1025695.1 M23 family metallopeptidase [Cytobacillus kochii]